MQLQKELLEHYIRIEGMPMYPVDPTSKEGRALLRDFAYRITDELVEASNHIAAIYESLASNQQMQARQELRHFNEELGDWWHFLLEFIVFADINESQLEGLVYQAAQEEIGGFEYEESECHLDNMFAIADLVCLRAGLREDRRNKFNIGKANLEDWGAATLGPRTIELFYMGSWNATENLFKAIHDLKHKPWAQTDTKANLAGFLSHTGRFFLSVMQLMVIIGKTPMSIKESYFLTNKKNQNRIKSGY